MLMTALYLLFIALINSFDNIGIRVAYSIGGIRVTFLKNLLISFMAFAVSFTASLSGNFIASIMSEEVSSILSMLLLSGTGIKIIIEGFSEKGEKAKDIKTLNYRQAISIGTALALDDIGGSVGVGMAGHSALAVGTAFFVISFLIFLTGNYAIMFLSKLKINPKITSTIAGLLMVAIGISQFLE